MKFLIYLSFFICCFVHRVYGELSLKQMFQIERYNMMIADDKHDTLVANAYIELSEILYVTNADTVITLCTKAEKIALSNLNQSSISLQERRAFKKILGRALNNFGVIHSSKGNRKRALELYKEALPFFESIEDKENIALTLNNIGVIYKKQGNISKALEYYHSALKINEEIGNRENTAMSYNNIGRLNKSLGNNVEALKYYNKSLKLKRRINNKKGIATTLSNIGAIQKDDNKLDEALESFKESLFIYKNLGYKKGIARSKSYIGAIYKSQKKLDKALKYFNESLELRKEIGDKMGQAACLVSIGTIELDDNRNVEKALNLANQGLNIAEEIEDPEEIQNAALLLSKVYNDLKNYKKGWEMYAYSIQMRDSVNNDEVNRNILQQEAKYQHEKETLANQLEFEKKELKHNQDLEKQLTYTYAGIVGFALMLLLAIVILRGYNQKKKNNIALEEQKHLIEEKNKEITDSITYAKRIQSAIIPSSELMNKHLKDGFIFYKPKDIVAGDFYWMQVVGDLVIYAAADCTGHGVPGAMVSVICDNALNRAVREYNLTEPAKILDKTRELVIERFLESEEEMKDGMDIALCALNLNTKELQYAGANNSLYLIRSGELTETKADKQPIGDYIKKTAFTNHTIKLEKGDTIYSFTDGFADQFGGPKGKKFMYKPFKRLLVSIQDKTMDEQGKIISDAFDEWKGDIEQIDDVCIIGVRI